VKNLVSNIELNEISINFKNEIIKIMAPSNIASYFNKQKELGAKRS
jgi:hypothetical protein